MKYKSNEPGVCPVCNSMSLDYDCMEIADDMIYYPWHCSHCNTSGEEWYKLNFAGHNVENKKDNVMETVEEVE